MKKIIVIEDDKVLREALTALLRENGYEVCQIVRFEKTEQQIAREKADLVLLDIILPGTNGQEILRNLRRISEVPVIMLTSKTGETDEILAMSYGADDYITKPYNPALLLLKIEALFRRLKPQEKQEMCIRDSRCRADGLNSSSQKSSSIISEASRPAVS